VDPRNILELTRIASDGTTKGASSKLAARMIDLLDRSKRGDADAPALFVTYSLGTEDGTTYRALREKGLRPVALVHGKAAGGGGARSGNRLGYAEPDKIRWEAGAAAGPARWDLLEGAKAGPIANAPGTDPLLPPDEAAKSFGVVVAFKAIDEADRAMARGTAPGRPAVQVAAGD
jgi:hypothetical protein